MFVPEKPCDPQLLGLVQRTPVLSYISITIFPVPLTTPLNVLSVPKSDPGPPNVRVFEPRIILLFEAPPPTDVIVIPEVTPEISKVPPDAAANHTELNSPIVPLPVRFNLAVLPRSCVLPW